MAAQVIPRLLCRLPGLALHVYRSGAAEKAGLAGPGVVVEGFVEDASRAYHPHRAFVAPLLSGAGLKGKVMGALAHGVPCVLSPVAAEGIGLRHGQECLVARTPEEWVDAILALDSDDDLWRQLSEQARAYVAREFSFERGREAMRRAFEAADVFVG